MDRSLSADDESADATFNFHSQQPPRSQRTGLYIAVAFGGCTVLALLICYFTWYLSRTLRRRLVNMRRIADRIRSCMCGCRRYRIEDDLIDPQLLLCAFRMFKDRFGVHDDELNSSGRSSTKEVHSSRRSETESADVSCMTRSTSRTTATSDEGSDGRIGTESDTRELEPNFKVFSNMMWKQRE